MTLLLIAGLCINPFYNANFTSLPERSLSVFCNPAGTGIRTGAEGFVTYHYDPDVITAGVSLANLGIGFHKTGDTTYFEAGAGVKLPGAFSIGYAYQFDRSDEYDISTHIIGIICRAASTSSVGFRTTLGERNHIFGGVSIKPYEQYVILSVDFEYEGIDSIFAYYYGVKVQPLPGLRISFHADDEFHWNAGCEVSFGKIIVAGAYSHEIKKFSGGIILSAQNYDTFLQSSTTTFTY
jgi:hypothetical protein